MTSYVQTDKRLSSSFWSLTSHLEMHKTSCRKDGQPRPDLSGPPPSGSQLCWREPCARFPAAASAAVPVLPAESPSSAHSPLLALGSALATAVVAFGDEGKEMVEEWDVEREWGGRCPGDHGGDGQGGRHPEVGCRK